MTLQTPALLPVRKISGNAVSAIGWGGMGLSTAYGKPRPDEERFKFLDDLYESGVTFWDSADVYGDNEDIIGQW